LGFAAAPFAVGAFQPLTSVPENQGVLYVYRPRSLYGSGFAVRIAVDDARAGDVRSGGYFPHTLSPGRHVIASQRSAGLLAAASAPLEIDVAAGASQYVRAEVNQVGPFSSRVVLSLVEESAALSEIAPLRLSD
jgi:hypothetical protein